MTIQKCDSALVVDVKDSADLWCVFEHQVVLQPNEPPTVILVGAAKLTEVYRLVDGKTNSDWTEIFRNGGSVLVRIIALTIDKMEAARHAQQIVRDMEPKPRCNLHGYSLRGARKAIICLNNGKRYETQTDAANDLGIHASAISRHVRGELAHANGFKFVYAPDKTMEVRP